MSTGSTTQQDATKSRNVHQRPDAWWLQTLRKRAKARRSSWQEVECAPQFAGDEQRRATIKYFNAAFRAEQSGAGQAELLSDVVAEWDAELAEILALYGKEEDWHRELLTGFLEDIGGSVQPMGRVTGMFFRAYARAKRMETIVLANLMFETIGATTYRLTLPHVTEPVIRRMLATLASDESFHVPLNIYFLRRILERCGPADVRRLKVVHQLLFIALVLLPIASRPKSKAFDQLSTLQLSRAYAQELDRVFSQSADLPLSSPSWLLRLLRVRQGSAAPIVEHDPTAEANAR